MSILTDIEDKFRPDREYGNPSNLTHTEVQYLIDRVKNLTDALERIEACEGMDPWNLGADNDKDRGILLAQEIIEILRTSARKALDEIDETPLRPIDKNPVIG